MKLSEAQAYVDNQITKYGDYWDIRWMMHRLYEEEGELSRVINIKYGDKPAKAVDQGKNLENELVDVFYTTIALANRFKIKLDKFNANDIEDIFLEFKNKNNDINYANVLILFDIKVGKLSSLMINEITGEELFNDEKNSQAIIKQLKEMIITIIGMAATFNVDLPIAFKEKVVADEEKLTRVYKS